MGTEYSYDIDGTGYVSTLHHFLLLGEAVIGIAPAKVEIIENRNAKDEDNWCCRPMGPPQSASLCKEIEDNWLFLQKNPGRYAFLCDNCYTRTEQTSNMLEDKPLDRDHCNTRIIHSTAFPYGIP